MASVQLRQLAITVSDIPSALRFYQDILGLTFLFSPSDNLAFLQAGDTRIMLTTPQGAGEVGKNSIAYFAVHHIESFYQNCVEQGADGERQPQLAAKMDNHDLWMGFLNDPDGNLVGLMEEKAAT